MTQVPARASVLSLEHLGREVDKQFRDATKMVVQSIQDNDVGDKKIKASISVVVDVEHDPETGVTIVSASVKPKLAKPHATKQAVRMKAGDLYTDPEIEGRQVTIDSVRNKEVTQ